MSTVAISALLTFTAPPQETTLRRYESKYYIVETDLPLERAQFIGRVMDATGMEYARRFRGFRGAVRKKPKVKVFATKEAYIAALARACGEPNTDARGYFCGLDGIVYSYEGDYLEQNLKHECFHQFASQVVGGAMPRWTHEGLATYFEDGIFDEKTGQLRVGVVPDRRVRLLRKARDDNTLFTVDHLMKLSAEQWRKNMRDGRGAIQYNQVWLLCHFLIHGDGGKYAGLFDQYLRHLDQGLDPDSAFKRVFGPDTRPLDEKLLAYIEELAPKEPKP